MEKADTSKKFAALLLKLAKKFPKLLSDAQPPKPKPEKPKKAPKPKKDPKPKKTSDAGRDEEKPETSRERVDADDDDVADDDQDHDDEEEDFIDLDAEL